MKFDVTAGALAAAISLLASGAQAADVGRPQRPMVYAPAKAQDWSGGYIGVHGGLEAQGFKSRATPNAPALNFSGKKNTRGLGGGSAGVQAGYNFQSGNVVYGVEGEASAVFLEKKKASTGLKAESNSRAALKGRLGYAFGSTLVYGVAGVAVAPSRYTSPANGIHAAKRRSVTSAGPLLGVGVEHKLTETVSLKAEADYAFQPRKTLRFPAGTSKIDSGAFSTKIGLNYHF